MPCKCYRLCYNSRLMLYVYSNAPFGAEIGGSTRVGGDHASKGISNQDALGSAIEGVYVFGALADGVSNSSLFEGASDDGAPTASGLAVEAFLNTTKECVEGNPSADPLSIARMGVAAANGAIREAKVQKRLPEQAATIFLAMVGSLVTGKTGVIYLGDPMLAKDVNQYGELENLLPPHKVGGVIKKTLKGQPETPVPGTLIVPPPKTMRQLVAYTDGMNQTHRLGDLRPELGGFPAFKTASNVVARTLQRPTAQSVANGIVDVATVTVPHLLSLDGMVDDGDDVSALVLRMWKRT